PIHQFQGGGAVVDAAAMEQFQTQWATYQKLVDHDLLSHRAVGNLLGSALQRYQRPFSIFYIACCGGSLMKRVLPATRVGHYHGLILRSRRLNWQPRTWPAWP